MVTKTEDVLFSATSGHWGGDPARGAAMGRANRSGYRNAKGDWIELAVTENARPFSLVRIRLDSGGYDRGGAYWGHGAPLWGFVGPVEDICGFVRAKNREAAKAAVREIHPHARFYR